MTAAAQPAAGQEAAAAALEDGRTVIDVRTQEEYDAGHIDGATLIDLQSSTFSDEIAKLDPEGAYVVYCHSGNRSAQAAAQMQAAGLDVVDGGGIGDMQAAGWTAGG
ncbi:MAG: rhodanese-like domain-containing protein [Acidimicrobiales bacterium]